MDRGSDLTLAARPGRTREVRRLSRLAQASYPLCYKVKAFLDRPIEGDWPYLWIDATYLKVRRGGRIVSVAAIMAVGVNADGRRKVLGMDNVQWCIRRPVLDGVRVGRARASARSGYRRSRDQRRH